MRDPAQILDQVLREADALIHRRLTERGLEFPHLVVAVIPDGPVIWHGNVSPDGLLSFVEDLIDDVFLKDAKKQGMTALKGHRSVGGMRASIYNAMPEAGVDALVSFMQEFKRTHG